MVWWLSLNAWTLSGDWECNLGSLDRGRQLANDGDVAAAGRGRSRSRTGTSVDLSNVPRTAPIAVAAWFQRQLAASGDQICISQAGDEAAMHTVLRE